MKTLLTFILVVFLGEMLCAQKTQVMFYGYTESGSIATEIEQKRAKKPQKIAEVNVNVFCKDSLISAIKSRDTGFYAILLEAGQDYKVVFEKEGYHCKSFQLNCSKISASEGEQAIKCLTDITLYPKKENQELIDLCSTPFAVAHFDITTGNMEWNMEYTEKIKAQLYSVAEMPE